jgi:hypothetical protein
MTLNSNEGDPALLVAAVVAGVAEDMIDVVVVGLRAGKISLVSWNLPLSIINHSSATWKTYGT